MRTGKISYPLQTLFCLVEIVAENSQMVSLTASFKRIKSIKTKLFLFFLSIWTTYGSPQCVVRHQFSTDSELPQNGNDEDTENFSAFDIMFAKTITQHTLWWLLSDSCKSKIFLIKKNPSGK